MSIEIDVLNGDASWPLAKPVFDAVWPPEVVAKLPWAAIVFAHAELRVLVQDESEDVLCHVGIYRREGHMERAEDASPPSPAASAAAMPASR
jgi:aminoglycoside 2'-N-acetyltransferase I